MDNKAKRIVVVLNEKIEVGQLINAAAHLALGFGASRGPEDRADLKLLRYVDSSGSAHPNVSARSLIVLKANLNQLRALRERALGAGLACASFTNTMTEGSYVDQLERTRTAPPEQLVYYGLLLFGTREQLDPLTRRFSLYKGPKEVLTAEYSASSQEQEASVRSLP
jgi:hypothetical protein